MTELTEQSDSGRRARKADLGMSSGYAGWGAIAQALQWPLPLLGWDGLGWTKPGRRQESGLGVWRAGRAFHATKILILNSPSSRCLKGRHRFLLHRENEGLQQTCT